LVARKAESEVVDQVVAAATDTSVPSLSPSPADLKVGVRGLLENGLSPGAISELLKNEPVVTPEDFEFIRREFSVRCLGNREWTQKLLSGDLEARRQLLAWHTIAITSRPAPWGPVTGVR
jgi:hypothetical protein